MKKDLEAIERKCFSVKRKMGLLLALCCLLWACGGAAAAEEEFLYDAGREVAVYLDEMGRSYTTQESEQSDRFLIRCTPAASTTLEAVSVTAHVYEDFASVVGNNLVEPDTSDMLKLYQTLESVNDGVSFVRFLYDANAGVIYPRVDIPYVEGGDFGQTVERYLYLTALVVDQHYDELAALEK